LQRYCVEKLGVEYIQDHISHLNEDSSGYVKSLACRDRGELAGDLFIDCSGATGLLIDKHFKAPFIDRSSILFNNKAMAVQVPYHSPDQAIASATLSTAQTAGWIWDIGLQSRRGLGYVYSDAHTNQEQVWETLKTYIQDSSPETDINSLTPKNLSFQPGYRSTPWVKNCVAIGMSSGFIEPLEASAIAMVEICSKTISNELPATRDAMAIVAKRYNARFVQRWESIIDFLKLHYCLSARDDSSYWLDNRSAETIPDNLKNLLELWKYQIPSTADFQHILELFGPPSYQYVLYGMGYTPLARITASRRDNDNYALQNFQKVDETTKKGLRGLPSNRSLLNAICSQ